MTITLNPETQKSFKIPFSKQNLVRVIDNNQSKINEVTGNLTTFELLLRSFAEHDVRVQVELKNQQKIKSFTKLILKI
jgi:predicted Ser/Thr protein kinase